MEAEGRVLRVELIRVVKACLLYSAAYVLVLGGLIALATGGYMALTEVLHPGVAMMVIGALLLMISFMILAWVHHRDSQY